MSGGDDTGDAGLSKAARPVAQRAANHGGGDVEFEQALQSFLWSNPLAESLWPNLPKYPAGPFHR